MTCGIYEIWIGENYYQGSSNNIEKRIGQHKSALRTGKHDNTFMLRAFKKHKTFDYQVLVECPEHSLLKWEQDYIDANWGLPKFMNQARSVYRPNGMTGKKHSDETKAKLSKAFKGKPLSEEHKAKLHRRNKKVICNGVTYESMTALAKHLGVHRVTIYSWKANTRKIPSHLNLTFTLPSREDT